MKNKLKGIMLVAAIALAAAWTFVQNEKDVMLSDLALSNVEALASGEINPDCPNGCINYGPGCRCNGFHPHYDEYTGWKN